MLKPEQRVLQDFQRLRGTAAHGHLVDSYADCRELLVTQRDPEVLRTLQGQAQALRQILSWIDEGSSTNGKRNWVESR